MQDTENSDRQDEDERDPYRGLRTKGSQPNKAAMRRTHRNKHIDGPARAKAAREAVATSVPRSIAWCLSHPQQARPHFTDFQWAILLARYPVLDHTPVRNSSVAVGEALDMTGHSKVVRKSERAAELTANELYYTWTRALEVWHRWKQGRGRRPTTDEFAILAKYRRRERQPKLGRHRVEPFDTIRVADDKDVADVGKFNANTGEWYGIAGELKVPAIPGGEYDASEEDDDPGEDEEDEQGAIHDDPSGN